MSIIEKLKNSIESATGLPFYYHSVGDLNEILDNATFPAAFAFLIESGAITDRNGQLHERLTLGVFFVNVTEFDFNAIENEDIITGCKRSAYEWLCKLRTSDDLQLVGVNSSQRVYDQFDVNLTGYGVNITVEEVEGFGKCDYVRP